MSTYTPCQEPFPDDLASVRVGESQEDGSATPTCGNAEKGGPAVDAVGAAMERTDSVSDRSDDNLQWGYKSTSRLTDALNRLVPHGGCVSNVYNMSAVTLGSGIFSLPYAFRCSGIAVAVVVLVLISASTVYSVYIMAIAVEKTRALAKREMADSNNFAHMTPEERAKATAAAAVASSEGSAGSDEASANGAKKLFGKLRNLNEEGSAISPLFLCSYESLARGLMGVGWDYFAAFNMWFFCFGSCVSYVITVNDLIATALAPEAGKPPKSGFLYENEWGSKVLTLVVWAVLMVPLCIPKQINSLRYVSVVSVTMIMYFVIVLIVHSCTNSFYRTDSGAVRLRNSLSAANAGNQAIVGFSMFLFAFLLQTNVLQLQKEATKPSPARMTRDCGIATTICTSLYILAGFFGYAEFGELLEGTVLRHYNVRSEPAVAVGFVLLGFKLCVSFALCMLATRDSVYYCMGTNARTIKTSFHVVVVVLHSILALILGLVIPDVEIVFSLVGSFSGGFLGFVFPAYFFMYAGNWSLKSVGVVHWVLTYLLLIAGVVAIVFGTCAAIYSIF